jgi:hypothetical protein
MMAINGPLILLPMVFIAGKNQSELFIRIHLRNELPRRPQRRPQRKAKRATKKQAEKRLVKRWFAKKEYVICAKKKFFLGQIKKLTFFFWKLNFF